MPSAPLVVELREMMSKLIEAWHDDDLRRTIRQLNTRYNWSRRPARCRQRISREHPLVYQTAAPHHVRPKPDDGQSQMSVFNGWCD